MTGLCSPRCGGVAHAVARSGETEEAFITRLLPAARRAAADCEHLAGPHAAAADPADLRNSKFAYGLEVVLDGLAWRIRGE